MRDVQKLDGDIVGDNSQKLAQFYSYWSNYLESTPAFLSFIAAVPGGIGKALYQITASLEHVFNNMFKLFGLFGYLGDQKTIIGQFFYWFQIVGVTIFTLLLVASAITGVFTKPTKYKNVIVNFLLVTFVTSVMPLSLTTIATALAQDAQTIQTISGDKGTQYSSLAIQPMKNNVVDLKVLIDHDFNTELFPMDDYGYIRPVKAGSTALNKITDSKDKRDTPDFATKIDFTDHYGVDNAAFLHEWNKKKLGIKGLLLHKLNANKDGVETITEHRIIGGLNAFEPVYLRYKVNWIGMFMQYIILIVLLMSMSIKFVKSVFDIIMEAVISPIQGYTSLSSNKKYKELLRTIGGAFAGIIFEVVIMRMTLEICRDLPTLSVTAITKLSGGFYDGLNMWEQCLAASIVYIGVFLAAMQGVTMIERWLGVSTGHSETAQQLLGAMMMGNAFATGAGAIGKGGFALAQGAGNMAMKTPGAVKNASKHVGNSLATTGGGIQGIFNAVKDQGIGNTVKGGISNAVDLAEVMGQKAVDYAGGVMDNLDDKAQTGLYSTYNALKNDDIPDQARFRSGDNNEPEYTLNPSGMYGGEPLFEDPSMADGGVSDPTISNIQQESQKEDFKGISEPSSPNPTLSDKNALTNSTNSVASQAPKTPSSKPNSPSSARNNLNQSLYQMNRMQQQAQQAGQYMQGQSHIKGAEIEDEEDR